MITAIIALAAQACGLVANDSGAANAGAGGTANAGARNAGAPNAGGGGSGNAGAPGCADANLLAAQTVTQIGPQRVFYSWTTDEQVAELRAGGPLFSRSESPGKGRGLAMTQLAAYGSADPSPNSALASRLANTEFAKVRFSWTNPWATLMGWPGETYGNQLLQIKLRPEAWTMLPCSRSASARRVPARPRARRGHPARFRHGRAVRGRAEQPRLFLAFQLLLGHQIPSRIRFRPERPIRRPPQGRAHFGSSVRRARTLVSNQILI